MKVTRSEFFLLVAIAALALFWSHAASACQVVLVPMDPSIHHPVIAPHPERIRPTWRPPRPTDLPFRVTQSRVDVKIEENVATTTITQTFLNISGQQLEVRVLIPLPKDAAINKSALSMDSQMVEGKLHNATEAQGIYESIVSQRRDPALLRFAGENLYEARIFPVEPNQERSLRFGYDQVLTPVGGLYDFRHILSGSQLYRDGADQFQFECTIKSKSEIGPVYSPSHAVAVQRPDPHTAIVKFNDANFSTDKDFRLYYAPSTEEVALRMVTHRVPGEEDGYFMILGRPDDQLEAHKVLSKELVLVLDVSGSMAGEKMEQAKKALTYCLSQLNPRDRFNLITFSTDVNSFSPGRLLDANKENVKKALDAVDTLEATGGTDIDGALRAALANDFTPGPAKAKLIIFLTDGLPSIGVTDSNTILKDATSANNAAGARIFAFGVGTDVNTHLLDRLSLEADGASAYVAPKEDLELKVSGFYGKIKNPVMTDVKLSFGEAAKVNSMYPRKLPALFKGDEILLFGRFKGAGPGTVELRGNVAGETREIKLNVEWPTQERGNDFLPRIWAMRKIGHLLETIRLRGANQETIDEIVTLSQRHGIVTPYTSQLVLEPNMNWNMPIRRGPVPMEELRGRFGAMKGAAPGAPEKAAADASKVMEQAARESKTEALIVAREAGELRSGGTAVGLAEMEKKLKEAKDFAEARPPAPAKPGDAPASKAARSEEEGRKLRSHAYLAGTGGGGARGAEADGMAEDRADYLSAVQELTVRQLAGRTFYLRGGVWVDSTLKLKEDTKPTVVKTYSKEYFELLKKNPDLGAVLALDGRILVSVDGQLYQIEPDEVKK